MKKRLQAIGYGLLGKRAMKDLPSASSLQLPANTLIIAILITTLFIFMVVGVMTLIVQSSLNIGALESATRANYGAESGVEIASLWLRDHQPGFQDEATFDLGTPITNVEVEVAARTVRLPKDTKATWNKPLGKLETASIPLFYDSGRSGDVSPLQIASALKSPNTPSSFVFTFDPPTAQFQWTVFGFTDDGSGVPASESVTGCVGGPECTGVAGNQINESTTGKFNKKDGSVDAAVSYYIRDFLLSHTQSYLVISNVDPDGKELRWRIEYAGGELSDDKFVITASGKNGLYRQTQRAEIPLGQFLPFFHFAIFSPG